MNDDDRELQELFARLKQEDRARIPAFRAPAAREASRRRWSPRIAVAAAVVLVALVLARPDRTPRNVSIHVVVLGAAAWQSPTDFLLITPGSELMRTVPVVGAPRDWTPIVTPGRAPAPESTRS